MSGRTERAKRRNGKATAAASGIGSDRVDLEDALADEDGPAADDVQLTGNDDQINDPIRIYLMQMGEIPLLTRPEEIAAATRIERSRTQFRHSMLATDYALQGAIHLLEKVLEGRLRLDRTVEVSVTNVREKRHILGLLGPNLRTLRHLLKQNRRDFRVSITKGLPMRRRREAWRQLVCRRNRIRSGPTAINRCPFQKPPVLRRNILSISTTGQLPGYLFLTKQSVSSRRRKASHRGR